MSTPSDRRSQKRIATRQAISDAATCLFIERGFDRVTVDEIAEAANVARMTVFNYFPRKEDMFFDLDEAGREELLKAVRGRNPATSPLEAVRHFAHEAVRQGRPYAAFFPESDRYIQTIEASGALKARARAIRDEVAAALSAVLAESVGLEAPEPQADLAAGMVLAVWTVAYGHAYRTFKETRSAERARTVFLQVVDQGMAGVSAAVAKTAYVIA